MKKVITFGVFDYFHYGHLRLLQRARAFGDYLMVAVQDEAYILQFKPGAKICYTTEQRVEMIRALRVVDEVRVFSSVERGVREFDFNVLVLGEDQTSEWINRSAQWCLEHGREVVRLTRTPGISSSKIKDQIMM